MLEFVIELIYIERRSAITVEFVELLNVSNDNFYTKKYTENENSKYFISYLGISFGYTSTIDPLYLSGRITRCYVR